MILIDSLYINNSGGLRLLEYLVKRLLEDEISFFLLADIRCSGKFDYCNHVRYMKASLCGRKSFYKKRKDEFTSVLCFGNIPAPVRLKVPVYTYFHNINLLTLSEAHSMREKYVMWLKREVFKHYKKNTDYWLVQTQNTYYELVKHLDEKPERVRQMPFYELPIGLTSSKDSDHGVDYVYISTYVPGKGHEELLEAWTLLHQRGLIKKLHLTVPYDCPFEERIKEAQSHGVSIENHGIIPFDKVIDLFRASKAIVYPSHNESLGLGLVEAIEAGCDVIASDLPFTHSICKPSHTFNPYSPESIADAIIEYEKGECPKSELLIYDHIDELITILQTGGGKFFNVIK